MAIISLSYVIEERSDDELPLIGDSLNLFYSNIEEIACKCNAFFSGTSKFNGISSGNAQHSKIDGYDDDEGGRAIQNTSQD